MRLQSAAWCRSFPCPSTPTSRFTATGSPPAARSRPTRAPPPAVCLPAFASEFYKLSDEERLETVRIAVEIVGGRLPVIGQANHGSARRAAELARANEKAGAAAVSVALPRNFAYTEGDLLDFART